MLVTLTVQRVNFHFLIYELIYILSIYFLIYLFIYLFIYLQLLATCCSAAVHRRHLMVWKIFAPRFVFEGVSFLLITVVLCFSYLVVLRIDQSLRSWFKNLEESRKWKPKKI